MKPRRRAPVAASASCGRRQVPPRSAGAATPRRVRVPWPKPSTAVAAEARRRPAPTRTPAAARQGSRRRADVGLRRAVVPGHRRRRRWLALSPTAACAGRPGSSLRMRLHRLCQTACCACRCPRRRAPQVQRAGDDGGQCTGSRARRGPAVPFRERACAGETCTSAHERARDERQIAAEAAFMGDPGVQR